MSANPILKAAFRQGDWHDSLCEQLWTIAEQQPSAANLKLALDTSRSFACVPLISRRIEPINYKLVSRSISVKALAFASVVP